MFLFETEHRRLRLSAHENKQELAVAFRPTQEDLRLVFAGFASSR